MEPRSIAQLARERRERRARQRLWISLFLALLLHVVAAGLWTLFIRETYVPPLVARPVTLQPLSAEQWARNRSPSTNRSTLPRPPSPPRPTPEQRPPGQVVDVAPGNHEESPDARYLAESSNRTQKETRAKEQTPLYRNAQPQRTSPTPQTGAGQEATPRPAGNAGLGSDDRPQRSGGKKGAMEVPTTRPRQELALRMDPRDRSKGPSLSNHSETQPLEGNSSRLNLKPGELGPQGEESSPGRVGPRGPVNLMPSAAVLDKIAGAAPNDHLQDVDEGEGTFLNTREWKYAGFFNRVKQSVGTHWDPGNMLRQRDPTGEIYSGKDRYTVLHVTLDASGSLRGVEVEKSSGLDFLDQEAIASFQRAQPFPNPPPGLLGGDSTVKFSFGFFLEMSAGTRMHLFRGSLQ